MRRGARRHRHRGGAQVLPKKENALSVGHQANGLQQRYLRSHENMHGEHRDVLDHRLHSNSLLLIQMDFEPIATTATGPDQAKSRCDDTRPAVDRTCSLASHGETLTSTKKATKLSPAALH